MARDSAALCLRTHCSATAEDARKDLTATRHVVLVTAGLASGGGVAKLLEFID